MGLIKLEQHCALGALCVVILLLGGSIAASLALLAVIELFHDVNLFLVGLLLMCVAGLWACFYRQCKKYKQQQVRLPIAPSQEERPCEK